MVPVEELKTSLETRKAVKVIVDNAKAKKPAKVEEKKEEEPKKGCGSVVGTGIAAIVAVVAACGFVSFKKKED